MGKKLLYIVAALMLTFASADATSRKTERVQVVVRQQDNGEWQMYVFGLPACPNPRNAQVIFAPDPTQPLEVECDVVKK